MHHLRIVGLLMVGALTACTMSSPQEASAAAASPGVTVSGKSKWTMATSAAATAPARGSDAELPADACTPDGYWSFFEAFVRYPRVRETHTAASALEGITPFRIALVDYTWYYVDAGKEPGEHLLDLKETRNGNNFRVDYVRVRFGSEDEVVETYGEPGAYVFKFANGCWQLAQHIP